MNNQQYPTARKNGLVVQEVPDELLVYDLDSNKAHCLNKTAALVWKSCDGRRTVPEIAGFVGAEAGHPVSDELVWLAIDQLSENLLLESRVETNFSGQSRREVLKKIGLASIVAVPVIASLVAPQNAMAVASCACTTDANCTQVSTCPPFCDNGPGGSGFCFGVIGSDPISGG